MIAFISQLSKDNATCMAPSHLHHVAGRCCQRSIWVSYEFRRGAKVELYPPADHACYL